MTPSLHSSLTSIHEEYAALAASYERRWRLYLEASVSHTLAALAPDDGEYILDAGCGTGILLGHIGRIAPAAQLVGIDLTIQMLQQALTRVSDSVVLAEADLRRLPFDSATFDAIVISSVMHYLSDPHRGLVEARRVLKPDGRLIVTDWDGEALRMRLYAKWMNQMRKARIHVRRPRELAALLAASGFQTIREDAYAAAPHWRLVTVTGSPVHVLHPALTSSALPK